MKTFVFTYGTLKKGFSNNVLLASSEFIQEAVTQPKYKLYDCGHYPCMVKSKKGEAIHGEIYAVDDITLKRLDRLEGVPFLYERGEIELQNFDKPTIAYFYQRDVGSFVECGSSWPRK